MIETRIRKIGRPVKRGGEKLEKVSVTIAPADLARLQAEADETGVGSVSAVVRFAVADYLRRLDKRRTRE